MISVTRQSDLYDKAAELLKAIAHPVRLQIVHRLCKGESCNVTSLHRQLNLPQSTVSQHLARLKHAGIISCKRNGNEVLYTLAEEKAKQIFMILDIS